MKHLDHRHVDLSVIIANYNVCAMLEQALRAVRQASSGLAIEVFVVDNDSSDGSIGYLQPRFPEVCFISNHENIGFSRANNQAISVSQGKYILLLNPDTIVAEDTLRHSFDFMERHPLAGAHGVKMINANGLFLFESKRSFPTPWNAFCRMTGLSSLFPSSPHFSNYQLRYLSPDEEHNIEVLSGAYMFIRRKALDEVGLLDEQFFMYGEDIDLSYRIILGGYTNHYLPTRILHYKGESTQKNGKDYYRHFYGAMQIFFRKHYRHRGLIMSTIIRLSIIALGAARKLSRIRKIERCRYREVMVIASQDEMMDLCGKAHDSLSCDTITPCSVNVNDITTLKACLSSVAATTTDILFAAPTIPYRDALEAMDSNPNKKITYHFYHRESGTIISPKH